MAYRDYRTLWLANLAGGAAAWALVVARGWLAFTLSGSSVWVGVVTFAAMVSRLVVPPFAGLLADRVDRRTILAVAFVINVAQALVLALLVFTGDLRVWYMVPLAFIDGAARATEQPAAQSLIPNLVPRRELLNAFSLNATTMHGSRLVGPGLAAPLLATMGAGGVFILSAGFYALGLFLVLRISTRSGGAMGPAKGVMAELMEGLSYVYRHFLLFSVILLIAFHCALTMSFESLLPVISSQRLGTGGGGMSYLMTAIGAGALVTTVALAGVQGEQTRGRLLWALGIGSALAPLGLAMASSLPLALLTTAAMGATQAGFMVITTTIVQAIVPDSIRGRVSSIYVLHAGGVMAFANLGNGYLADLIGAPLVLTLMGSAFLMVMAVSLLRPVLRQLYWAGIPRVETAAAYR